MTCFFLFFFCFFLSDLHAQLQHSWVYCSSGTLFGFIVNSTHINRDKLGFWQKCVEECKKQLTAGRSVAIDNTSPDVELRKKIY